MCCGTPCPCCALGQAMSRGASFAGEGGSLRGCGPSSCMSELLVVAGRDTNKEIYEKICEMRAAYKAENDKYWEEERAFRAWYKEEKKRKCVSRMRSCAALASSRPLSMLASPVSWSTAWQAVKSVTTLRGIDAC